MLWANASYFSLFMSLDFSLTEVFGIGVMIKTAKRTKPNGLGAGLPRNLPKSGTP